MTSSLFENIIDEYLSENPYQITQPDSESAIVEAEHFLNVTFDAEYKKFIKKYGGALVGPYSIFGLTPHSFMGCILNTITLNMIYYREQNWPDIDDWVIISRDFSGNPIGIAPDGKVLLSDHDCGFEQIKMADSFNEFLVRIIEDRIFDED